jgi:hypothetical protein
MRENLVHSVAKKREESAKEILGKIPLTVSFDMGWQRRGMSFNSLSGHAFIIDVGTGKVIGKRTFSKKCRKCAAFGLEMGATSVDCPPHNCSMNYGGSSKGMEATAALEMVKDLFENEEVQAFVNEMVLDDDASTRALLSHSLRELAQKCSDFVWPVDANGKKVPKTKDVGKLPFNHPIILFLADLTHRIRCFGKYTFGLANSPQKISICTMVDAYRLKRNFGYWLMSYHTEPFDIFKARSKAVVEHHFNNHTYCEDWCSMKKATSTQAATGNLKYRSKIDNPILYKQVVEVMERFVSEEKLRECHHGFSSQKNESMNKLISRYVPKDRTFSQSMSLASRICLAVGVDSVGHESYYKRLLGNMNISLPKNTTIMLRNMKKKRDYDRFYQAQPHRKRKRANLKFAKMKDGLKKQMADKATGLNYQSGLNMMTQTADGEGAGVLNCTAKPAVLCKFCGSSTHKTRRSKNCKYFGWSNELVDQEMVRINILKATTEAVDLATAGGGSEVQSGGKYDYFYI